MAHHKRRRPKSARAGCLLCKPHKRQGAKRSRLGRWQRANGNRKPLADAESW